ncbi:MAG: hypothetical protein ACOYNL_04760 [Rickettsiales bacterium]
MTQSKIHSIARETPVTSTSDSIAVSIGSMRIEFSKDRICIIENVSDQTNPYVTTITTRPSGSINYEQKASFIDTDEGTVIPLDKQHGYRDLQHFTAAHSRIVKAIKAAISCIDANGKQQLSTTQCALLDGLKRAYPSSDIQR